MDFGDQQASEAEEQALEEAILPLRAAANAPVSQRAVERHVQQQVQHARATVLFKPAAPRAPAPAPSARGQACTAHAACPGDDFCGVATAREGSGATCMSCVTCLKQLAPPQALAAID